MMLAPTLFISHGSPMFALEPGRIGSHLARIGRGLDGPRAILVVSPHWQTQGLRVGGNPMPSTLHDFGGFPAPLYALRYPAPGDPALATAVQRTLSDAGLAATIDTRRGLDHGAWVPLLHLRPEADLPVLQVSMPHDLDAAGALALGRALAPLRETGMLLVGSGSLTHNLGEFRQRIEDPAYAAAFGHWVADAVARGDTAALVDYRARAPHAVRAHPTEEHFLPLLVALGTVRPGEGVRRFDGGMAYGTLSMDAFGWGLPAGVA